MGEKPVETALWMLALAVVAYLTLRSAAAGIARGVATGPSPEWHIRVFRKFGRKRFKQTGFPPSIAGICGTFAGRRHSGSTWRFAQCPNASWSARSSR
jgi:hypothetical protein